MLLFKNEVGVGALKNGIFHMYVSSNTFLSCTFLVIFIAGNIGGTGHSRRRWGGILEAATVEHKQQDIRPQYRHQASLYRLFVVMLKFVCCGNQENGL